jgi:hypothetical protein
MLYYMRGPDTYDPGTTIHSEYWYQQKQGRNDRSDLWHWFCTASGRYYFHFYAIGSAVGDFHCNISRDTPVQLYRFASDSGTLWWEGITDLRKNDVYRIWLEAKDRTVEGVEVTVTWPNDWHRVHLYAYDLVDAFEPNLLNLSYCHEGDTREVIRFTASYTGWYYIRVEYGSWSASETYSITTREYTAPNDGDNTPKNATHLLKSGSIKGRMEASRDMHDWFTVDLVKADLLGISMQIMDPNNPDYNPGAPNFFNFFEIQVYDPYMRRVRNGYDRNGGWPVPDTYINNLPIQTADITLNGTYYIRASFSHSYGYWYDVTNTSGHFIAFCDYVVQFTFPNRAPKVNTSALEEVIMLEDTTWWETLGGENVSSLDLNTVFIDPEQGVMSYSVGGDANVTARLVGDGVTLKPRADWNGEANVSLMADDDSGNSAQAVLHVVVVPVNDRPRLLAPELEIEFLEDDDSEANRTINLYQLFWDVDEADARALSFAMRSHPDITSAIDEVTGNVTLLAKADIHGEFVLTFDAFDLLGASIDGTVTVTVLPVNDGPKAIEGDVVYNLDEGFMLATFDAAEHLFDPDGDTDLLWFLEYVDPADEALLLVTNEGRDTLNSAMVVTPAQGKQDWFGEVRVEVTCIDPGGLKGTKEFTIVIANTPDPPEISEWSPLTNPSLAEGGTQSFEVVSVMDPDGEEVVLHYSFLLKGPEDVIATEVQNTTDSTYVMAPDFESEGVYVLSVVVFDDTIRASVNPLDWTVTVTKTNRRPEVTIVSPEEGQVFKEDKWVELSASVTDPDLEDQDGLTVEWFEGDIKLGQGRTYSVRNLKPGAHVISVVVTDPDGGNVEQTVTIRVKKVDEGPGFGALMAAIALYGSALFMASRRLRFRP